MKSFEFVSDRCSSTIHYVIVGPRKGTLCCSPEERSDVCHALVGASSAETELIAYCVTNRWLRAVVQTNSKSLSKERLAGLLSGREQHERSGSPTAVCAIVRSARLASIEMQLGAIRHCHMAPVELSLVREAVEWAWSSHSVYMGQSQRGRFSRSWLTSVLAQGYGGWLVAYQCLMGDAEVEEGEGVSVPPRWTVPVLPAAETAGDFRCLRALEDMEHGEPVDEEGSDYVFSVLTRSVCRTTGSDVRAFRTMPGARRFRLERALLLEWIAGRRRFMSVAELSKRLQCDRSWLYKTREQCRRQYPDLFVGIEDSVASGRLGMGVEASLVQLLERARYRRRDA